jgi:O-antigen ligase/tetratricopeptide (TPR) repeat protein
LSHLLILTALVAVPLAYPFAISSELDFRVTQWVTSRDSSVWKFLWTDQFQPALYSGYDPLTLKRGVWAFLALALGCTHFLWKLLPGRPREQSTRKTSLELLAVLAFIVWAGMSLMLWLPVPEGGTRPGAGFLFSLDAWSDLVIGIGFFILAGDLLRRRRSVFKGVGLLFATATLIALLAQGQRMGWTRGLLPEFADMRNRMSSLVGHSTGMASFLMPALLLSVALGLPRWRKLSHPAALLFAVFWFLMALTITMSQSRAVLLILLLLIPILLWRLHMSVGLSPSRMGWAVSIGGVLLVVLLQVLPWSHNPFYDHSSPLARRVNDLSIERLTAETRLRILTCSIPLFLDATVQGHGFGSFQYVYPRAQGEYFQKNAGTVLVPTGKRTMRAHNEYLQILLETGLAGLLLALGGLLLVLRRGWITYSRTLRPDDIPIQLGVLVAVAAILIHAAVDFPLRVPPIAVTLVWLLAVWYAGEKIWLPRRGRFVWPGQEVEEEEENAVNPPGGANANGATSREDPEAPDRSVPGSVLVPRWQWALWGLSALVLLVGVLGASSWFARRVTVDTLNTRANRFLDTYMSGAREMKADMRIELLRQGRTILRRSLRLRPSGGETHLVKAFMEHYLARESLAQALSAREAGQGRQETAWLSEARIFAGTSLESLQSALNEVRYHQVFHLRGENFRLLAQMGPTGDDMRERAAEQLRQAIAYSPGYAEAIVGLIQLLRESFPDSQAEQRDLLELLHRYNPQPFTEYFLMRGHRAMEEERYPDAVEVYQELVEAVPNDPTLLACLASASLRAGDMQKTESLLGDLARANPRPILYELILAGYAIERQDWAAALAYIDQGLRQPGGDLDLFRVMRVFVLEKSGQEEAFRSGYEALRSRARRNPQVLVDIANVLADHFRDLERALPYIQRRIEITEPPPPPRFYYLLARRAFEKDNDSTEARRLLQEALRLQPDHGPSRELLRRLPSP